MMRKWTIVGLTRCTVLVEELELGLAEKEDPT
jgi:hypothetical protein